MSCIERIVILIRLFAFPGLAPRFALVLMCAHLRTALVQPRFIACLFSVISVIPVRKCLEGRTAIVDLSRPTMAQEEFLTKIAGITEKR